MASTNITELQKAANYYAFKKSLKNIPLPSVFFAVLTIFYGLIGALGREYTKYYILVVLGILVLLICIWASFAENKGIFLYSGIINSIMGVMVLIFVVMDMIGSKGQSIYDFLVIFLGSFSLMGGVFGFSNYKRFSSLEIKNPGKDMLQKVKDIISPVAKANINKDTDIIQITRVGGGDQKLNGKLGKDIIVFSSKNGNNIIISNPENFDIKLKSQTLLRGGYLGAFFNIGSFNFKGLIKPESYKRYEEWKSPEH